MKHHVHLHAGKLGNVVIAIFDLWIQGRDGMRFGNVVAHALFESSHECLMLIEQAAVFVADFRSHLFKVFLNFIKDASNTRLVCTLTVELVEHRVRVIDRSDGAIRARIDHACPSIRPVRYSDSKLKGPEAGLCFGFRLKVIRDLLVDRYPACPTGRCIGATLNVSWIELDPGEQTPDAAHVVVAISPDLIADTMKRQQSVFERLKGSHDPLEGKLVPFFVWPKLRWDHSVGTEYDYQTLLWSCRRSLHETL